MRAATWLRAPRRVVANATLVDVKRRRGRITFDGQRRTSELSASELIHLRAPVYGAMSAGVRQRRELERPELDLNERMRRRLEELRGLPRSWRSG
jgi:hypothetical protein